MVSINEEIASTSTTTNINGTVSDNGIDAHADSSNDQEPEKEQAMPTMDKQTIEEGTELLRDGKRLSKCANFQEAAKKLADACAKLSEAYGQMSDHCAEAYFEYGRALLEVARTEPVIVGEKMVMRTSGETADGEKAESSGVTIVEVPASTDITDEAEAPIVTEPEVKSSTDGQPQGEAKPSATVPAEQEPDSKKSENTENTDAAAPKTEGSSKSENTESPDIAAHKPEEGPSTTTLDQGKNEDAPTKMESDSTDDQKEGDSAAATKGAQPDAKGETEPVTTTSGDETTGQTAPTGTTATPDNAGKQKEGDSASAATKGAQPDAKGGTEPVTTTSDDETTGETATTGTTATSDNAGKQEAGEMAEGETGDKVSTTSDTTQDVSSTEAAAKTDGEFVPPVSSTGLLDAVNGLVEGQDEEEDEEDDEEEDEEEEVDDDVDEGNTSQDEDVSNIQLSWEMLDLARLVFEKAENRLRAAECQLHLAQVSMESEMFEKALDDLTSCMATQQELLEPDDRRIAETSYEMGVCYLNMKDYSHAEKQFLSSIQVLQKRKTNLETKLGTSDDETAKRDLQTEIDELGALIPDVEERAKDARQCQDITVEDQAEIVQATSPVKKVNAFGTSVDEKKSPVKDISHLVRKPVKRMADLESDAGEKRAKTEDIGTAVANGH